MPLVHTFVNSHRYLIIMKLILSIFLSITLSPLLAQNIKTCTDTIQVPFGDNKMGEYIGCLNYEGIMDGYGTLRFPDSTIYKGNFVRGKMDDLNGELIYTDGDSYIGGFKNNMKNGAGTLSLSFGDQTQISVGDFDSDRFSSGTKAIDFGEGMKQIITLQNGEVVKVEEFNDKSLTLSSVGDFFPNYSLKNGTKREIIRNYEVITELKNGEETSRISEIENYYTPEDIEYVRIPDESEETELIVIPLEFEENDDSKYVNLGFETTNRAQYRFIFDTGAEVFNIGYRLFKELEGNGLQYEDLDILIPAIGVLGEPMDLKVIRISRLTIGNYVVNDVIAYVSTVETANSNLLGIQFLKKFKQVYWSLNDNKLIFYK